MSERDLDIRQFRCLLDLVKRPLVRTAAGWGRIGESLWHQPDVMAVLALRGLVTVTRQRRGSGDLPEATITPAGRARAEKPEAA